jgi:predicted transcriptional regulator
MKNKKLIDKKFDIFIKFLERTLEVPEIFPNEVIVLPLTDEEWKTVFSERRIELIKAIIQKRPKSVNDLVKSLKRHQEAISRDLKCLENIGVIKVEARGKTRVPTVNKKLILMPLMMPVKVNH